MYRCEARALILVLLLFFSAFFAVAVILTCCPCIFFFILKMYDIFLSVFGDWTLLTVVYIFRCQPSMEAIMNPIWPRVFLRFHRKSLFSRRSHSTWAEKATVSASTNSRHMKPTLLVSRLYQPSNLRDVGQDSFLHGEMTCKSQRLMQQAGLIHPSNPGCYYYLPATVRSMEKLVRLSYCQIIRDCIILFAFILSVLKNPRFFILISLDP